MLGVQADSRGEPREAWEGVGVESIDNDYVKKWPIEIVEIVEMGMVDLKIGRKLARIGEERRRVLEKGFVYLMSPDVADGSASWEELISCNIPGYGIAKGFTDDPRLIDIGKKVLTGESLDLEPGTIIPPLEEK
jgi:hypothetical protein